jgi:hypothetical protein
MQMCSHLCENAHYILQIPYNHMLISALICLYMQCDVLHCSPPQGADLLKYASVYIVLLGIYILGHV